MHAGDLRKRKAELDRNSVRLRLKGASRVTRYRGLELLDFLPALGGGAQDSAGEIANRLPIRLFCHATLHSHC
jgi:hypothetical protein